MHSSQLGLGRLLFFKPVVQGMRRFHSSQKKCRVSLGKPLAVGAELVTAYAHGPSRDVVTEPLVFVRLLVDTVADDGVLGRGGAPLPQAGVAALETNFFGPRD